MSNKLEDFRLINYDERSHLLIVLQLYKAQYGADVETKALIQRLSRTECQPGGCLYCNADRAREVDDMYMRD